MGRALTEQKLLRPHKLKALRTQTAGRTHTSSGGQDAGCILIHAVERISECRRATITCTEWSSPVVKLQVLRLELQNLTVLSPHTPLQAETGNGLGNFIAEDF